jgi:hypothetical protein
MGTRERAEIFEKVRGSSPSRAMAKGTRATVRLTECRAPKAESIMPSVSNEAPPAPSRRTMTAAATEEASGTFAMVSGLSA